MATQFTYDKLKEKYGDFQFPLTVIEINGQDAAKLDDNVKVTDVVVDLTSGFEATMANFTLVGYYNTTTNMFLTNKFDEKVKLGMGVKISVGYSNEAVEVFYGYITHINFVYNGSNGMPGIKVTCMDVKAAMMSNRETKQFPECKCYSDAVKKIIETYKVLDKTKPKLTELKVFDTPDKPDKPQGGEKESDVTIEMTDETDYEFCVRAAKKFNYEFFCHCGTIYFRAAKSEKEPLITLSLMGLFSIDIEYTNVGITESVEVKAMDPGKEKLISNVQNNSNSKIFQFKGSKRVFVDPTVHNEKEAEYRAKYLLEENSYKHCTLKASMVGIPELTPGRFFLMLFTEKNELKTFYLTEVKHFFDGNGTFSTQIVARSCDSFS